MVSHNFIYFSNIFISDVVRLVLKHIVETSFCVTMQLFPVWYALDMIALQDLKFLANMATLPLEF